MTMSEQTNELTINSSTMVEENFEIVSVIDIVYMTRLTIFQIR